MYDSRESRVGPGRPKDSTYDSPVTGDPPPSAPRVPQGSIALVEGPIEAADALPSEILGGGTACFLGTTRPDRHPELGDLVALDYEAADLATARLAALADSIVVEHALLGLTIQHAVGAVPVGRTSVRIVASAEHRAAAFDGCRAAIDRLKREIPIWKREVWEHGSTWSSTTSPLEETT